MENNPNIITEIAMSIFCLGVPALSIIVLTTAYAYKIVMQARRGEG
jgi:hypothetical protein